METETEGDKDDRGVKGFKVKFSMIRPGKMNKKESTSKEAKALPLETLLLIISFVSARKNK